jgi:hypothetical protein
MEDVGIFYRLLVYFAVIWYILWPLGIFYGYLVYFSQFWYGVHTKKNLATLPRIGTSSGFCLEKKFSTL